MMITATMRNRLLPVAAGICGAAIWWGLARADVFPPSLFPSPGSVVRGLMTEITSGRLANDIVTSLWRVMAGFMLAVLLGIPAGLYLGRHIAARATFLPAINFFRSLSPLAWIPFAILWFGIGDAPAIFLIFIASFFPVVLSTLAASAAMPAVYFRVAHDFGITGRRLLLDVMLPAIAPGVITTLRVTIGLAWLVVVAAEMIAGRDGLGFAIWDARNGLRMDLLVANMLVVGLIGVGIDRVLRRLTTLPNVRWGYEQ
ncbi:MAG TPA: ABC transporter permease [Candidatus Kapabacteria bacterium]|nr:ABC transporter permease [Candidatus Kapabacteria bacterium]